LRNGKRELHAWEEEKERKSNNYNNNNLRVSNIRVSNRTLIYNVP